MVSAVSNGVVTRRHSGAVSTTTRRHSVASRVVCQLMVGLSQRPIVARAATTTDTTKRRPDGDSVIIRGRLANAPTTHQPTAKPTRRPIAGVPLGGRGLIRRRFGVSCVPNGASPGVVLAIS